ncbi:hypothetical protein BDD12DRAFT_806613 [Trichophaea hybrida]|nr:hypothetical protein BDD12DRAFT_806613 [Trichophaea hybrida]
MRRQYARIPIPLASQGARTERWVRAVDAEYLASIWLCLADVSHQWHRSRYGCSAFQAAGLRGNQRTDYQIRACPYQKSLTGELPSTSARTPGERNPIHKPQYTDKPQTHRNVRRMWAEKAATPEFLAQLLTDLFEHRGQDLGARNSRRMLCRGPRRHAVRVCQTFVSRTRKPSHQAVNLWSLSLGFIPVLALATRPHQTFCMHARTVTGGAQVFSYHLQLRRCIYISNPRIAAPEYLSTLTRKHAARVTRPSLRESIHLVRGYDLPTFFNCRNNKQGEWDLLRLSIHSYLPQRTSGRPSDSLSAGHNIIGYPGEMHAYSAALNEQNGNRLHDDCVRVTGFNEHSQTNLSLEDIFDMYRYMTCTCITSLVVRCTCLFFLPDDIMDL